MDTKPADLILVRGEDLIGNTIELITRSPYSHVAGLVKQNELIEAQAFRRTGYQGLDFYAGHADVFTCDELSDKDRARIIAGAEKYVGRHYSYLLIGWELLRYTFGVMLMPSKNWQPIVCSTLWAMEYRKIGIDLCPGIRFPSPADIAKSKRLRKVDSL